MQTVTSIKLNKKINSTKIILAQKGFTLIELMIVVLIIGVLAKIAMPSYVDYVKRGKAAEATSTLADLRVKMEQYYQDNRTYVGGTCAPASGAKYFTYSCTAQTATAYTLQAAGNASENMGNFNFTVDESNAKTSTFDGTSGGTCWLTNKGATC
jgi:type IV pilus assembly protein PilE